MPSSTSTARERSRITICPPTDSFLNLPSPYYDEFSLPATPHSAPKAPVVWSSKTLASYLPSFLQRLSYRRLPRRDPSDDQGDDDEDANPDVDQGYERKPRFKHVHWTDSNSPCCTNGLILVVLLLLLSLLLNGFLLFEGPPNGFVKYVRGRRGAAFPHDAFDLASLGKNYTCYHTHEKTFSRIGTYERLDRVYDYDWKDILGGSDGYVHMALNRPDGQVRKARFGMFHQLECLSRIRSAVQKLGQPGSREDIVFSDDQDGLEGEQGWRHCFDYLRQVVQCNADDTLETSEVIGAKWPTQGYRSRRQCRNPEWLYDATKCGEHGCKGGPFYYQEGTKA